MSTNFQKVAALRFYEGPEKRACFRNNFRITADYGRPSRRSPINFLIACDSGAWKSNMQPGPSCLYDVCKASRVHGQYVFTFRARGFNKYQHINEVIDIWTHTIYEITGNFYVYEPRTVGNSSWYPPIRVISSLLPIDKDSQDITCTPCIPNNNNIRAKTELSSGDFRCNETKYYSAGIYLQNIMFA